MSINDTDIPCDLERCQGCSYCSDAYGVDAIKDANAEAGHVAQERQT